MPKSNDCALFEPQDRLTIAAADPLLAFLNGNAAASVCISMRHQKRPDSRVIQLLLAATAEWRGRNLAFDVCDLSPRLMQDFTRLGLTAENTKWSGLK